MDVAIGARVDRIVEDHPDLEHDIVAVVQTRYLKHALDMISNRVITNQRYVRIITGINICAITRVEEEAVDAITCIETERITACCLGIPACGELDCAILGRGTAIDVDLEFEGDNLAQSHTGGSQGFNGRICIRAGEWIVSCTPFYCAQLGGRETFVERRVRR